MKLITPATDLDTLSRKKVRHVLEAQWGVDLKAHRRQIQVLVDRRLHDINNVGPPITTTAAPMDPSVPEGRSTVMPEEDTTLTAVGDKDGTNALRLARISIRPFSQEQGQQRAQQQGQQQVQHQLLAPQQRLQQQVLHQPQALKQTQQQAPLLNTKDVAHFSQTVTNPVSQQAKMDSAEHSEQTEQMEWTTLSDSLIAARAVANALSVKAKEATAAVKVAMCCGQCQNCLDMPRWQVYTHKTCSYHAIPMMVLPWLHYFHTCRN